MNLIYKPKQTVGLQINYDMFPSFSFSLILLYFLPSPWDRQRCLWLTGLNVQ